MTEIKINKGDFSSGVNLSRFNDDLIKAKLHGVVDDVLNKTTHLFVIGGTDLNNMPDRGKIETVVKDHDGTPDPDSALNSLTAITDPTVNDDIDAGYSKGSIWINTLLNKIFIAVSVLAGAAVWKEIASSVTKHTIISFAVDANPYIGRKNLTSTYEFIAPFPFPGTTNFGTPTKIKIISKGDSIEEIDIKIEDSTHSLTIVEKTGLIHTVFTITDLGTLSNLPTDEAIFEIQAKSTIGEDLHLGALIVEY